MKDIARLLFEIKMLKSIPRSGYGFLGNGSETVAEHCFVVATIGFVMAQMDDRIDAGKLVCMCLLHDLAEARTGDLNYVQKLYVTADETAALDAAVGGLPFGDRITGLVDEFNQGVSKEAALARDADQIAFLLDLKAQIDRGYGKAQTWYDHVAKRIRTDAGRQLVQAITDTEADAWWLNNFIDSPNKIN